MKKKGLILALIMVLLLGTLAGCRSKTNDQKSATGGQQQLTIAGSTSVQPLSELLAEGFMAANPGTKVTVQGGGSGVGIEQAIAGTINIGSSSRELKAEEKAKGLNEFVICKDGIAVIVNKDNGIKALTMEQIKNIFAGKVTNWKDVGGSDGKIAVINREAGSGTRGAFEELVMGKDTPLAKSVEQSSTGAVKSAVSTDKNAIGYVSLTGLGEGVHAVTVNGVEANAQTVKDGKYPISRPFLYLTKGTPSELAKKFYDYIESAEGQKIIQDEGLVLLK
ncbi:MAG: phosphate ABC transporter substrate-binding protein [Methylocystaceae bacterium]